MGRGGDQPAAAAGASRRADGSPRIRAWIKAHYTAERDMPSLTDSPAQLLAEHGSAPADFDPLEGMAADIRTADPADQLTELTRVYGGRVAIGHALTLSALGTAETAQQLAMASAAEKLISHHAALNDFDSEEEAATDLFSGYREWEARLHWSCRELGWPSDWTLEAIRTSSENFADSPEMLVGTLGLSTALPPSETDLERDLITRYGERDEDINPLIDLPDGIEKAGPDEKLRALAGAYGELAAELAAFEAIQEGEESPFADDLRLRLQIEAERSGDDLEEVTERWAQMRSSEEAQLVWASRELGFPASAVLRYLQNSIPRF